MRVRAVLLISVACGALLAFASAASALQIGAIDVPLTVPPALETVVGTTPVEPPDATVDVPDTGGVTGGVTSPDSVGPVTVAPDSPSVQVTVDPSGVDVTSTPDSSGSTPAIGSGSDPATDGSGSDASSTPATPDPAISGSADSPPAASDPTASSRGSASADPSAVAARASKPASARATLPTDPVILDPVIDAATAASAVEGTRGSTAWSGRSPAGATPPAAAPKEVAVPDAVNASLQHAAPGGSWTLAGEAVTGRFALWLALLAILGVVRWALIGLVRDARRRAGLVSSL
jgi:hypothetical protein